MISEYIVSVVIPIHNTANYLRKCVESVRNQSLKDVEIILVDNLSTDGSSDICDEYALIDSRIKVLHLLEAGPSIARNAGIKLASAPYIGFVDSDDYIHPTMYQELYDGICLNKAELAYCNFCYEYEDGHIELTSPNSGKAFLRSSNEVLRDIMWGIVSSSACTKLFRRDLFDSLCFPEGVFFEDHITTHKWVAMCTKIVWIDKTLYNYYQRSTSTCHTLDPIKYYHNFLAEYSRLNFIKEHSLFNEKELSDVNSMIVSNCLTYFKKTLLMVKPVFFRSSINDMKSKIQDLRFFSLDQIDKRCYKRVRKISYFWAVYYFFHFYFKKRTWRP